ncbi:MAG: PilZ domain-containing protein [Cyclobacteriaceae bacterium]
MKFLPLSLLTLISLLGSCTSEPVLTIEFCEELTADDQCPSDRDQFKLGERVFVRLSSDKPFETKTITGKIVRLENEKRYELGDKNFELEPGSTYVTQNIPFHEFGFNALGTFSIEFSDESGQLLAKREVKVTQ